MRKVYKIGGYEFRMRTFTGRDLTRASGHLGVLPVAGATGGGAFELAWKSNAVADALLAVCSKSPKIVVEELDEIPEGVIPVSEIPDPVYMELVAQLCKDSGFSAEAADEVRPTSETSAEPSPSTPSESVTA